MDEKKVTNKVSEVISSGCTIARRNPCSYKYDVANTTEKQATNDAILRRIFSLLYGILMRNMKTQPRIPSCNSLLIILQR